MCELCHTRVDEVDDPQMLSFIEDTYAHMDCEVSW